MNKTQSTDSSEIRSALQKHSNRVTYLVRLSGNGYNTVKAISQEDAERQAKVFFGKYGIISVALPKPGEIEALDEFWASQFR